MDQKKLINLYNRNLNSMFDNAESETEIEDSVKDSHDELNTILSNAHLPELFHCILDMMNDYDIPHESNKYLTKRELDQIDTILDPKWESSKYIASFFENFNPPDGDFSIIFKYLRNVKVLGECCFYHCVNLKKITIPNKITKISCFCFKFCENLEKITILYPPNILLETNCIVYCYNLKEIRVPNQFKNYRGNRFLHNIKSISSGLVNSNQVKLTYI